MSDVRLARTGQSLTGNPTDGADRASEATVAAAAQILPDFLQPPLCCAVVTDAADASVDVSASIRTGE